MHIDHILPTNMPQDIKEDVTEYIKELEEEGFIQDSIKTISPHVLLVILRRTTVSIKHLVLDIIMKLHESIYKMF